MVGAKTCLRMAGLAILAALCVLAWRSGVLHVLGRPSIVAHEAAWRGWVASHPMLAPLAFIGLYAAAVALSLPLGLWLSLLSGLLFGTAQGGIVTTAGASLGAVALFLLARGLLAPLLRVRLCRQIDRLRPGFERDGVFYLLALRLMPVFPFWLVNLAPALLGMQLAPYVLATVLGMIPAAFVLASIGAGLNARLAAGAPPDPAMLFSPAILLPLLAFAALAVMPALWRQWQAKTPPDPDQG